MSFRIVTYIAIEKNVRERQEAEDVRGYLVKLK